MQQMRFSSQILMTCCFIVRFEKWMTLNSLTLSKNATTTTITLSLSLSASAGVLAQQLVPSVCEYNPRNNAAIRLKNVSLRR